MCIIYDKLTNDKYDVFLNSVIVSTPIKKQNLGPAALAMLTLCYHLYCSIFAILSIHFY